MAIEEGTVSTSGTTVRYWVHGPKQAPWLVVAHGMALNSVGFMPLIERLADRWRILRWDFPGHGQSGAMPEIFGMDDCVAAGEAVLADAVVNNAVLFGFSFGGIVTQYMARRNPDRVRGLILYGCRSPILVKRPSWPIRRFAELYMLGGDIDAIRRRFASLCSRKESTQNEVIAAAARLDKRAFRQMTRALLDADGYDPAARFPEPILWIRGEHDVNNVELGRAETMLRRNHSQLVSEVVAGAGHCAHQDDPKAFGDHVERFLDRCFAVSPPSAKTRNPD